MRPIGPGAPGLPESPVAPLAPGIPACPAGPVLPCGPYAKKRNLIGYKIFYTLRFYDRTKNVRVI